MAKRKKHTAEQIVRKLRKAERLKAEGATVAAICQQLEISEQTYHRWRNEFGGMDRHQLQRLKELEEENRRLKRLVADQALDNQILKEVAEGKW
jgi:transposase-like protein